MLKQGIKVFLGLILTLPVSATSLELGELDQGKYGFNYFGKKNRVESFDFIPSRSTLKLSFDTYGISHERELKLYVNNKFIRFLKVQGIVASGSESIGINQLYPGRVNTIKFSLDKPTDDIYGITNLLISLPEAKNAKIATKQQTNSINDGLVGYWPFDGNSDDVSGNNNDGKEYNNPVYPSAYIKQGLKANGAFTSVSSELFDNSKFTIMAWIKPDNVWGGYRAIIEKDRWKSDWYGLYQVGNKIHFRWGLTGTTITKSMVLEPNVFTHVAGIFDGSSARIYINGILKKIVSGSSPKPSSTNGELRIGITGDGTEAYQGTIDEAKVFVSALDQEGIKLQSDLSPPADLDNKPELVEVLPTNEDISQDAIAESPDDTTSSNPGNEPEIVEVSSTNEDLSQQINTETQVDVNSNSSTQPSGQIKLYNPPKDVAEFESKELYYSETLSSFGIAKAGVNSLKSSKYKIEVKPKGAANSKYQEVFTYQSLNNLIQDARYEGHRWSRKDMTDANHWGSFDFKGEITVKVTSIGQQINSVSISPKSKNHSFTNNNGVIELDLSEAQLDVKKLDSHKISLKFSGSGADKHPLFIFANRFETDALPETNHPLNIFINRPGTVAPPINSNNIKFFEPGTHASGTYSQPVLYFKPGLHTVSGSGRMTIASNTTVYLAGGAYVMGQFYSVSQSNIKIYGRGVLSGVNRDHDPFGGWADAPHLIEHWGGDGSSFIVKGITLTDSAKSNIYFDGNNASVSNVKVFGWRPNTDGVTLRQDSSVRDSFFKVFDDTVKLFRSNSKAEEIIIWQQPSGAAFQLGWNTSWVSSVGYVNNIDLINSDFTLEKEREGDANLNNAIVSIRNFRKTSGKIDDFQFNNIRIEGRPYQILDLGTVDGLVPGFAGSDSFGGSVQNLVLRNLISEGLPRIPSYIKEEGPYGDVGPVTFEDVIINGEKLTGLEHQGKTMVKVFGGDQPIFK